MAAGCWQSITQIGLPRWRTCSTSISPASVLPPRSIHGRCTGAEDLISRAFPLVTAAAPAYLATRGEPRSLDDLADHDLIDIVSSTTGRRLDWQFRVEGQRLFRPARAALAFDNSEAAIAAAVSGAGIVQNISYALADPIAEGRLVPILADLRDPGSEVHLLTRRQDRPPARLRVFASLVDHVVRERRERDAAIFGPDRASA